MMSLATERKCAAIEHVIEQRLLDRNRAFESFVGPEADHLAEASRAMPERFMGGWQGHGCVI